MTVSFTKLAATKFLKASVVISSACAWVSTTGSLLAQPPSALIVNTNTPPTASPSSLFLTRSSPWHAHFHFDFFLFARRRFCRKVGEAFSGKRTPTVAYCARPWCKSIARLVGYGWNSESLAGVRLFHCTTRLMHCGLLVLSLVWASTVERRNVEV